MFRNWNIDEWDWSVVCDIFFITVSIYDRYDFCSRANTHDANVFPGLIHVNIIRPRILLINIKG